MGGRRIAEEKAKNRTACRAEADEDPFFLRRGRRGYGKTVARGKRVIGHRVAILEHAKTDGERRDGESVEEMERKEDGLRKRREKEREREGRRRC